MLDRFKLFQELEKVKDYIFDVSTDDLVNLKTITEKILNDPEIALKIGSKKWSLLVPSWQGILGKTYSIEQHNHPYQVCAVDGSQIYYDKHQGPACSLINVGTVYIDYGLELSKVDLNSYPEILVVKKDQSNLGTEYINLYREQSELIQAYKKSYDYVQKNKNPFLCLLDGSLIFFQIDYENNKESEIFFKKYMEQLELFFEQKILHVAYMSFPKTKDIINVAHIVAAEYDEKNIKKVNYSDNFVDTDILDLFLSVGQRTIIFESKAPICYVYPQHLKPYFCYLHVQTEIIRLEFPAWIAEDEILVDKICAIVLDQAQKGYGYPVVLFEAHEQAVIKSADRDFFYETLKNMYVQNNKKYKISAKSIKKISPIL